jgi:hypothetical protein
VRMNEVHCWHFWFDNTWQFKVCFLQSNCYLILRYLVLFFTIFVIFVQLIFFSCSKILLPSVVTHLSRFYFRLYWIKIFSVSLKMCSPILVAHRWFSNFKLRVEWIRCTHEELRQTTQNHLSYRCCWVLMLLSLTLSVACLPQKASNLKFTFFGYIYLAAAVKHSLIISPSVNSFFSLANK